MGSAAREFPPAREIRLFPRLALRFADPCPLASGWPSRPYPSPWSQLVVRQPARFPSEEPRSELLLRSSLPPVEKPCPLSRRRTSSPKPSPWSHLEVRRPANFPTATLWRGNPLLLPPSNGRFAPCLPFSDCVLRPRGPSPLGPPLLCSANQPTSLRPFRETPTCIPSWLARRGRGG